MRPPVVELMQEQSRVITIASVARELGISRSYLHHILAGRKRLSPGRRRRIADLLGVPVSQIIQGEPVKRIEKREAVAV